MRRAVGQHERDGLAGTDLELGDRGHVLAAGLDGRAQHRHVRPADREQCGAIFRSLDPGNAQPKPNRITSSIRIATRPSTPRTRRTTSEASAARRHEIDQGNRAVSGLEAGFQDQRVVPIAARNPGGFVVRGNQPTAIPAAAEDRGKTGLGVESRPAQPVDRPVTPDQRGGLAVADQAIIFDP